jgi:beta-lactamase regulating signal transducer with metallopeptidase domain
MLKIKKGETGFRVIIVLIAIILTFFLIYNVKDISNLLTGNVALTSNALNEEVSKTNKEILTNISLALVFLLVIGLVALFIFINYLRRKNKK